MVFGVWQTGAEDVHRDQETHGRSRVRLETCCHSRNYYFSFQRSLVCVLIDEVESLTAARKASGSEPSDAIRYIIGPLSTEDRLSWGNLRVVNALLTQLDQIKMAPNVLILTTSNITGAIDGAFVDRADIVQYIGPPNQAAVYQILFSAIQVHLWVKVFVCNCCFHTHLFLMSGVGNQEYHQINCVRGGLADSQVVSRDSYSFIIGINILTSLPFFIIIFFFYRHQCSHQGVAVDRVQPQSSNSSKPSPLGHCWYMSAGSTLWSSSQKGSSFVENHWQWYFSGSLFGLCSLQQPQQDADHQAVPGQPWERCEEAAGREDGGCPDGWWGEGEGISSA